MKRKKDSADPWGIAAGMCAAVLAFALGLPADAEFPLSDAWRLWRYSAPVDLPVNAGGLVAVEVTAAVTAHSQPGWPDLRVVNEQGRETPFVLHSRQEKRSIEQRPSRLLEVSFKPGESTQGIVDLGEDAPEHNSLEIDLDQPDYFLWVEVAISSDGRSWRILNERSPIYRFAANGLDGNQTVPYSTSRSRFLRVRLLEGGKKLPLDGVLVAQEVRREAERVPLEFALTGDPAAPPNETWFRADMEDARQPVSEVRFEIAQPEFHRAVRVSTSNDGQHWGTAGQGDIYRIQRKEAAQSLHAAGEHERLRVRFAEAQARYWRVEVLNRNDAPLAGLQARLLTTPRRAVFRAEPGHAYRLVIGNPRAATAQYEMQRLTPEVDLEAASPAALGPVAVNSAWTDPTPWTEQHPYVLWIVLLGAAAVLGLLALRALRA